MITDAEVDTIVNGPLSLDIDLKGDAVSDAVSLGIGISAVAGTFTPPS